MVNTSADGVHTVVHYQPMVLPEQVQVMRDHTPRPQCPAPAPSPPTPEPHPRPRTLETHPLSGLEDLGLVTPHKPHPVVPSLREPEVAGNTADVDVDQHLLSKSAGGNSLLDVPLPDIPLLGVFLPEACPDGSVG